MPKLYEHLHIDITPAALEFIAKTLERFAGPSPDERTAIEVQNFINECRARVQHAAAGILDLTPPDPLVTGAVPGHSSQDDWLG